MKTRTLPFLILLLLYSACLHDKAHSDSDWHMQPVTIQTPWASQVSPVHPLPEYPRPQMVRPQWQNLNGLWDYAITAWDAAAPTTYQGKILVPFPIESALSGVKKALLPRQRLWYHTTFKTNTTERTLLHFGAIDWKASVYLNGHLLGSHLGGYHHFSYDITSFLQPGNNDLVVSVYDPTSQGNNPHGKQSLYPRKILYTACSGIWQTVWLEHVPDTYIAGFTLTPDLDAQELKIKVNVASFNGQAFALAISNHTSPSTGPTHHTIQTNSTSDSHYTIQAISNNFISASTSTDSLTLHIPSPHTWS
ncbi:sugar-binding domain-containing protein, partial [Chitinophaga sp.]|uniref:sugar-binding domain-containing protein n=1 Tax=Chitinophaga sp. TaxID=1869181 RepID=UPI0031DFB97E